MSCLALGQEADSCGCCTSRPCDVPSSYLPRLYWTCWGSHWWPVLHSVRRHFVPWEYMWSHREQPRGAQMALEVLLGGCVWGFGAVLQR